MWPANNWWWQGWPSDESTCLPPMWPRFDFCTRCPVDWVCWFSTLPWEVFPRVLRFSPLIKNQHLIWFVNNDCKNNDLGNVDLISSGIVKRIWSYSYANLRYRNIKHYYYYHYYYNCLQISVLLHSMCETTLLCENGRSVPKADREWFDIFSWSKEQWSNDKTIIELGYHKISWFGSVSQINNYLPQQIKCSANNWLPCHWQVTIFCPTSLNNC